MSQTLVAIFEDMPAANRAVEKLVADGFERSAIDVKVSGDTSVTTAVDGSVRTTPAPREDEGVLESIGRFFSDLFGGDDEREYASHYSEAVRRGKAVLTLRVDDESRLDDAHATLLDSDAVDVDESVSAWRSEGYQPSMPDVATGRSTYAVGSTPDATRTTTASTGTGASAGAAGVGMVGTTAGMGTNTGTTKSASASASAGSGTADRDREGVIPVVQEEIEVGKRRVEQGRVRVVSHVETKPVHESVELRSEKAVIERRPVDRPASEADLSNLQDRTIEVRESAEKAVVNKTAHVVEEVVVGKQVSSETRQIDDSVRRTDVSVERDAAGTGAGSGVGSTGTFDEYRDRFRSDYQTHYASSGGTFEDYEPAYRSGYALRDDARYQGQDWTTIEPQARRDWESRYPDTTWERVKGAVRRGWERI